MLIANKPGLYRVIGDTFELLCDIKGEAPYLTIGTTILMNDLVNKGIVTQLTHDSLEIQRVLANPDKFIFIEFEYSEIAKLPPCRKSIRGEKMPVISDELFMEFVNRYIQDTCVNKRGVTSTKAYIMAKTDWTASQTNLVILQIGKYIQRNGILNNIALTLQK